MNTNLREAIKDKKRIVVKIGSSSLQHSETGDLDYIKIEKLVRELCDIRNQGKDVVLVTSTTSLPWLRISQSSLTSFSILM